MAGHRKRSGLAVTSTVDLAGSALTVPCHVCALYDSAEAQHAALLPFLKEGLEHGERAILVVDPLQRDERIERLKHAGIDVDDAERNGQLVIDVWNDVYFPDGRFDPDAMLNLVQEKINTGHRLGFKRTRVWANMEWALQGPPGSELLAIYESRLNYILPLYGEAVVCAYDVTRFPASLLEDVVRAHPHLCTDGCAGTNPRYEPPDDLLPELESRLY